MHGTQFIDNQILSAVALTQKLPKLKEKCVQWIGDWFALPTFYLFTQIQI